MKLYSETKNECIGDGGSAGIDGKTGFVSAREPSQANWGIIRVV